jgi:molecular chaperone GrpE
MVHCTIYYPMNETESKPNNSNENSEPAEHTNENTETPDSKTKTPETDYVALNKELNDKFLRLYSDFENFRKRSLKERAELIKTASEDLIKAIIPVLDDLERAIKANQQSTDTESIKAGFTLIHHKLSQTLKSKGLESFECAGQIFNSDTMEAITHIPAENADQNGKVVDEIEKGYKLGEKVIRFAKVVVAQ